MECYHIQMCVLVAIVFGSLHRVRILNLLPCFFVRSLQRQKVVSEKRPFRSKNKKSTNTLSAVTKRVIHYYDVSAWRGYRGETGFTVGSSEPHIVEHSSVTPDKKQTMTTTNRSLN